MFDRSTLNSALTAFCVDVQRSAADAYASLRQASKNARRFRWRAA